MEETVLGSSLRGQNQKRYKNKNQNVEAGHVIKGGIPAGRTSKSLGALWVSTEFIGQKVLVPQGTPCDAGSGSDKRLAQALPCQPTT